MELIHGLIATPDRELTRIPVAVDRHTLARRRWRGPAADGRDFGFDLEWPLQHGEVFFADETRAYVIEQSPEPVLQILILTPGQAARVAWQVGNLHFPVAIRPNSILVEDDSAIRQMLQREGVSFTLTRAVFQPVAGAAGHHQHHEHGHAH